MRIETIRRGLEYAAKDYIEIAQFNQTDVKPKEDQIKCALYRALSEDGYTVQVEASSTRNGGRCDVFAVRGGDRIGIEIKTAWAGSGKWVNKPWEQSRNWAADIAKLRGLSQEETASAGFFVLGFMHEGGTRAEAALRRHIVTVEGKAAMPPISWDLPIWNGLDRMEFHIWRIF